MIRAVLDTNILVSAAIKSEGKPAQILRQSPGCFELITSEYILDELTEALGRKHIQKRYPNQVTPDRRARFLANLRDLATIIDVTMKVSVVKKDEEDNFILACAAESHADYLVTGDPDLLDLGTFDKITIVTPNDFLKILLNLQDTKP